jgi:hypothetical protein
MAVYQARGECAMLTVKAIAFGQPSPNLSPVCGKVSQKAGRRQKHHYPRKIPQMRLPCTYRARNLGTGMCDKKAGTAINPYRLSTVLRLT